VPESVLSLAIHRYSSLANITKETSSMTLLKRITLGFCLLLVASRLLAADLSGLWKNDEQATWIDIQFDGERGTGTVARNDDNPKTVGKVLLKEVVVEAQAWRGQIYAKKLNEFKDAELSLTSPDQLKIQVKVGFFSKTINWTRVPSLPADES